MGLVKKSTKTKIGIRRVTGEKIYDGSILDYKIDFVNSKIIFKLMSEQKRLVEVLFEEFFAFHFEDQLPNSILLDIIEGEVDLFVLENKELLEKGKDYYWPMNYDDEEELINYIKEKGYHYFKIQASYGLNGWILAERMILD